MAEEKYVIGIDFGTLSGRAVVVRASDGQELGTGVHDFDHGVLDDALPADVGGKKLPPEFALQVPDDYIQVLKVAVPAAVAAAGIDPADVIGVGTDFTSATVLPTTTDGTPLCELPEFADRPHAYVKLWKHHGAQAQADRLVAVARERGESWLSRYGGTLSAELGVPKALETLEKDPEVYAAMDRFVDAVDWIVWRLTGTYVRSAGSTGYKFLYQDGSSLSPEYLAALNPDFSTFVENKLQAPIGQLGDKAGTLSAEAAAWTGLPEGIAVAVGNIDAHVTAPAGDAVEAGQMTAILGTSTCFVVSGEEVREVPGMFGVVKGGLVKGLWGYEAGQSAVGDLFGWFVDNCVPGSYQEEADQRGLTVHQLLTEKSATQEVGEHGLIALDWHNGNRSVLVDHGLSGLILGQTLATRPEDEYRALLEATAFGARTIVEAFRAAGVPVTEVVLAGGLLKNPLLVQIYADVLRLPLSSADSSQAPALGSAIHAAVAAGAHPDVASAAHVMGRKTAQAFLPDEAAADRYDVLFAEYTTLHDYFGRGTNEVMHRLKAFRHEALSQRAKKR